MRLLIRLKSFLAAPFVRHCLERARELHTHGPSQADVHARARYEVGDVGQHRNDAREASGLRLIDELTIDLGSAAKAVTRNRTHSVAAIIVIAVGMTATTHVATEFNAVFWRTLPVRSPETLRMLVWSSPKRGFATPPAFPGPSVHGIPNFASFSYPVYKAMRDAPAALSDLACWLDPGETMPVVIGDIGVGSVHFVSGNFFTTLGVRPVRGRLLSVEDEGEFSPVAVAVLSEAFWRATFAGDLNVLDKRLTLNGTEFQIVGVAEAGFLGLDPSRAPDLYVPIGMLRMASASGVAMLRSPADWSVCRTIGRLRPGVSEHAALAAAQGALLQSVTTTPNWPRPGREYEWPVVSSVPIDRGLDTLRDSAVQPLLIVSGVVAVLLSIAVANVAGLLLARGVAREHEVATRLALGAGRLRIWRQLVGEALVLSLVGGAIGVTLSYVLAQWVPGLLNQLAPAFNGVTRPLGVSVAPDLRVLGLSAGVTVMTAFVFGSVPAIRAARTSLTAVTRGATAPGRAGGSFSGEIFLVMQAALATVLLIGAALFVRTVLNLQTVELGFRTDRLLYARVEPRGAGMQIGKDGLTVAEYQKRRAALLEEAVQRLASIPGVLSASATTTPPLAKYDGAGVGAGTGTIFCTEFVNASQTQDATFVAQFVAPRFFETLQMPIVRGRDFTWTERTLARQTVAIVNQTFLRRFIPNDVDPIGVRYGFGPDCPDHPTRGTIIGVVPDSRTTPRAEPIPMLYQMWGAPARPLTVILRTDRDPAAVIPALRAAMQSLQPSLPVFGEVSANELLANQIRRELLVRALLLIFAGIALLLTSFGIYAVTAFRVRRRTSEIAVRMALGAERRQIAELLLRAFVRPIAIGVGLGVVASFAVSRWLQSMLYGLARPDVLMLAIAVGCLLTVAAVGCLRPLLLACRVDPATALREM